MKLPLVFLAAALLFSTTAVAAETQTAQTFKRTISRDVSYRYLLHLPPNHAADPARQWPLIIFLHGSGERGEDPWLVAKHGPPRLLRTPAADGPAAEAARVLAAEFIVVSPQCPLGTWWDDEAVLALADEISARHRVDPARVHLTGLSMGGYGTWSIAVKNPSRFASVVPICGGGDEATAAKLRSLPIRCFHGAADAAVPVERSRSMVAAVKAAGGDPTYTEYEGVGHDSWTPAYRDPATLDWLFRQRR